MGLLFSYLRFFSFVNGTGDLVLSHKIFKVQERNNQRKTTKNLNEIKRF